MSLSLEQERLVSMLDYLEHWGTHNKIVSFDWGIADDTLRDPLNCVKYPDVMLSMCVIPCMDAVLEPSRTRVPDTKTMRDDARIIEQRATLRDAVYRMASLMFLPIEAEIKSATYLLGELLKDDQGGGHKTPTEGETTWARRAAA